MEECESFHILDRSNLLSPRAQKKTPGHDETDKTELEEIKGMLEELKGEVGEWKGKLLESQREVARR